MRADGLEPATYTVGEVRDLAEKIFVTYHQHGRVSSDVARACSEASIQRALTFASAWSEHVKVKP